MIASELACLEQQVCSNEAIGFHKGEEEYRENEARLTDELHRGRDHVPLRIAFLEGGRKHPLEVFLAICRVHFFFFSFPNIV
jgi:hypothetical protein